MTGLQTSDHPAIDEVTSALADYATGVSAADLPDTARREVSRRLIDTIASACAGLGADPVTALQCLCRSRPLDNGCQVWGTDVATTPEAAALANGAAIRFLDYNDYTVGGHPSDNLAAIIAAAEWVHADVDDLVVATVVNYEVFGELGRLLIRSRGWDQGTTAAIAAACAAGRVLGLNSAQMSDALGMVVTGNVALGKVRRGQLSAWKGVAGAYAAQGALLAVQMAAAGVSGPRDAFAGEFGFFEQISGSFEVQHLDPAHEPHYIHKAGYKHWPVQFDAQPAVWLGIEIRGALPLDAITGIAMETSHWTWRGIGNDPTKWAPTNRETADHSLPYILAVAMVRGEIRPEDFAGTELRRNDYHRLMSTVTINPAEDITASSPTHCTMRATVSLHDRTTRSFEVSYPRSRPMPDRDLDDKWSRLTARLGSSAAPFLHDLRALEGDRRIRDLLAPLGRPTASPRPE